MRYWIDERVSRKLWRGGEGCEGKIVDSGICEFIIVYENLFADFRSRNTRLVFIDDL